MKVTITFKDPDAVSDAIDDAIERMPKPEGLADDEWQEITERRRDALSLKPHILYGEYCTVEIDTDAGTAVVVPTT